MTRLIFIVKKNPRNVFTVQTIITLTGAFLNKCLDGIEPNLQFPLKVDNCFLI